MRWVKNKYLRLSIKIVLWALGLNLLLLSIAGLYIHYNKDKIMNTVKTAINNATSGEANIGDIHFSVLNNFPNIGITLENVSILDSHYHKPLIQVSAVGFAIGLRQFLTSDKTIAQISVKDGNFHLFRDSSGYSNSYLLQKKSNTQKTSSSLTIKRALLENVNFLIEDAIKNKKYDFSVADLHASFSTSDSIWNISLSENAFVRGLGFNLSKGNFLEKHEVDASNWKLKLNTAAGELSFDKSKVEINHHPFTMDGKFHFTDSSWFHLDIHTEKISFESAAQILSKNIRQKVDLIRIQQPVTLDATLSGPLEKRGDPYVAAEINVPNTNVQTDVTSLSNCSFKGYFNNHTSDTLKPSDENTSILLTNFTANWNGIDLKTNDLIVRNLSEPTIAFAFFSHTSLTELDSNLALNTISLTGGTADVAISYNGPLIADPTLLSKLNLRFKLKNANALYEPRNIAFTNCSGEIILTENTLAINNLVCNVAKDHFEVNAFGDNISRIAINDSGKTFLNFTAESPSLNLANFISLFGEKKSSIARTKNINGLAITASKIDDMLEKGTVALNIKIAHLVNRNFSADNVNAYMLFAKDNWQVKDASLQHAGGVLQLSAGISEVRNNYHQVTANVKLTNVDVSKVFYAFNNFGIGGFSYKNIRGTLNTTASLQMALANSGAIIPGTMQGNTNFSIHNGALINYQPIMQIKDYILQDRDLSNIEFGELKNNLAIKNDIVHINRMEIASSAIRLFVEGDYGITGNTDISIQVPFSNFLRNSTASAQNHGANTQAGPSIFLRAKTNALGKVKLGIDFKAGKKNKKNKK